MGKDIEKRHGDTHHANGHYGTYLVYAQIIYIFLFLVVLKRLLSLKKLGGSGPQFFNSKFSFLLRRVYTLDPVVHMGIILLLTMLPFPGSHFKSYITEHYTVYFKKFGKLSYAMLVLNLYLVVPRSNTFLVMSYLDSIHLHIWLSRFILVAGMLHSVLFMIRWIVQGVFWKKILKLENFIGFVIFVLITILFSITSVITDYRRRNYKSFYFIHQITIFFFIVLTILHADPGVLVPFGLINIGALVAYILNRFINYEEVRVIKKSTTSGSDNEGGKDGCLLTCYELQRNIGINERDSGVEFARMHTQGIIPGSHLRITNYSPFHWKHWFYPSHPYTIVDTTEDNLVLQLIVKKNSNKNDSFKLQQLQRSSEQTDLKYYLTGIYPPSKDVQDLVESFNNVSPQENNKHIKEKKLVLIAGGSGISFVLSLYKQILKNIQLNQTKEQEQEQEQEEKNPKYYVKIYWIVRNFKDLHILKYLNKEISTFKQQHQSPLGTILPDLEVYITRKNSAYNSGSQTIASSRLMETLENDEVDEIEIHAVSNLEEEETLNIIQTMPTHLDLFTSSFSSSLNSTIKVNYHLNEKFSIPLDLPQNLDFFGNTETLRDEEETVETVEKWLCCCGPTSLLQDGKDFSQRHKDINYVMEEYQF